MKKSTFEITSPRGEKSVQHGYVYGAFGVHKNRYTHEWSVTHPKTGLRCFSGKKLSNVKAFITIMNDRFNWDGDDQHELAKLNGMSLPDFYAELKGIISEIKPTQQEKHT